MLIVCWFRRASFYEYDLHCELNAFVGRFLDPIWSLPNRLQIALVVGVAMDVHLVEGTIANVSRTIYTHAMNRPGLAMVSPMAWRCKIPTVKFA